MAMPPVLVFGEPLQCIPHDEQPAVVGYRTTLRRMLGVTVPPFLSGQGDEGCTGQPQLDSPPHGDPHNEESGIKHKYSDSNKIGQDVAGGKLVDKQESHINAVAEAHGRQEMYLHKVSNSIPAEFFQLDLALALELESKRLQCHTRRYYRDWCLHRIGVPRWIMNPAYQVLPHSAFHRSHLPEETADILFIKQQRQLLQSSSGGHGIGEKKRAKANREKRRRCALCRHGFSWLSGAKECGRCQRHVCEKCISENPVRLIELGIRNACAYVCLNCSKKVERLEDILMRFRWSEHEGGVDTDTETEEAIDFYARSTIPRIASVLPLYPNHSSSYLQARPLEACGMPYQLTLHPLARVVSAPGMDSDTSVAASISPLFEEVLGVEGLSTSTLVSWRCVVDEEWTESATRISRHVVILLPHPAAISHGELHYTLAEAPRGAIEVQLQVGDSLQSLRLFHSTSIAPYTATGEMPDTSGSGPQVLKLLMQQQQQQQQQEESASPRGARGTSIFTALFFVGAVMDLALLRVEHFSVWGCFTPDRPGRCAAYYKCKPDMCRYGGLHTPIPHCTSGVLGVACLPRMLPMTRPIPLRNMILHTDTELVLFEFDFAAPSTVCGFALELHHPAAMTTSHCGIATALRLIGVSASGYRGNLGLFHLPWPPLPSLEMNLQEIFAYAYSLPLPVSGIVSVLVEVVEWRLVHAAVAVGSPSGALKEVVEQRHSSNDDEDDTNNGGRSSNNNNNSSSRLREAESPPRRGIYLGKLHFWTSADASTRRMVSSHTYTSVHAALDGADPN
ncbi:hypothetical protein DQ04_02561020 [Trypanosoma grayi]|uniref:hypothetical protein n=1 Tax=Trypanosoma grayi TaxID=71804 RepID=UPI0004F40E3E|nr:hypothetical protein DQ04_02561020 [Trypanosoma grayi]KEG11495.1 hypothetical protein DQ04_02561020 [Trypanosoma grayi]